MCVALLVGCEAAGSDPGPGANDPGSGDGGDDMPIGGEVVLSGDAVTIDSVVYTNGTMGWNVPDGRSLQLSPANFSDSANDDGTNWCESVSMFGLGDYGTPGTPNADCP